MTGSAFRASVGHEEVPEVGLSKSPAQLEVIARQARKTFGETLPQDFLSPDEYVIYERLFGPPSATILPEDFDLPGGSAEPEQEFPGNVLMKENVDGELEEVIFDEEAVEETEEDQNGGGLDVSNTSEDFRSRVDKLRELAATQTSISKANEDDEIIQQEGASEGILEDEEVEEEAISLEDQLRDDEGLDQALDDTDVENGQFENSDHTRTHPMTAAGRSGTSPATIQFPKDIFVDPITALLADVSTKQVGELSLKTFGGPGLPNSTATVQRPNVKQQPIALEASQSHMGDMGANAFLAAIMPGAYATIKTTLVEVRKRLGSEWLRSLIDKPGGPRVLDAGAGGAGILAWREILRAEWELMHPDNASPSKPMPLGKSTVITGSNSLRYRASRLLDDTTFIPRLPDYDPSRDHPSLEHTNPQPRKQYDIILAPHTLWSLKEGFMRKNQVQNFWSLLDPKGGVLILLEKGVPRGFELVAGARETLLKYQVASPGAEEVENTVDDVSSNRFGPKEKGMIIAPCTNHGKCPMYITAGSSQGRKDYCHFSQRFIRPPFLQNILGSREHNHEAILFSYVALQRGVDQRETHNIIQGQPATEAAFSGYEEAPSENQQSEEHQQGQAFSSHNANMSTLGLPRAILPPIKRRGHVVLDLCTPSGKIERWTVPKSFSKQAYRDARKSKWGDLWALGAKTRVPRNIRVGIIRDEPRGRNVRASSDEGDDGEPEVFAPRQKRSKGHRKPKSETRKREMLDHDY